MNESNRGIVINLGIMVFVIVGLVIAIIMVNVQHYEVTKDDNISVTELDNLLDVEQQMIGWDGSIDDSAKALSLKENIDMKLKSDSDYNSNDAIAEYNEAYSLADGNLKCYIAIDYANFYYSSTHDLVESIDILEQIDVATLDDRAKVSRLYAIKDLYESAGDNEKVDLYAQQIDLLVPDGTALINLEEVEE